MNRITVMLRVCLLVVFAALCTPAQAGLVAETVFFDDFEGDTITGNPAIGGSNIGISWDNSKPGGVDVLVNPNTTVGEGNESAQVIAPFHKGSMDGNFSEAIFADGATVSMDFYMTGTGGAAQKIQVTFGRADDATLLQGGPFFNRDSTISGAGTSLITEAFVGFTHYGLDATLKKAMSQAKTRTVEQMWRERVEKWSWGGGDPKDWPCHLPSDSKLVPVDKNTPHQKKLNATITKLKQDYARSDLCDAVASFPKRITGKGISKVFPDHHFYVFWWSERPRDPKNTPAGLMYAVHASIGISKKGDVTWFHCGGNFTSYEQLLRKNRVKISNIEDAQNVWEAFCEIYRKDEKARPVEKVSDTVWRLGVHKYKTRRGSQSVSATKYHEVTLNENLSFQSMKSRRVMIE